MTCLTYISSDLDVSEDDYLDSSDNRQLNCPPKKNWLLNYATSYWGHHAREEAEDTIIEMVLDFLQKESNVVHASRVLCEGALQGTYTGNRENCLGIHMLSFFGLEMVMCRQLEDGALVDSRDQYGRSPLLYAAKNGHGAVVRLLLARDDVKVNSMDRNGMTPLSIAALNGHDAVVRLLLAREDIAINSGIEVETAPLPHIIKEACSAVVSQEQQQEQSRFGLTPLSNAAEKGHDTVVRLLLERHDVEVNSKGYDGRTPLSRALSGAVYDGHEAVVRLLLAQHDIEVNSKGNNEMTPLSIAAKMGQGHDLQSDAQAASRGDIRHRG